MKLIDFIRQIFDMDSPMGEANVKLKNTLCLVNGKLSWVNSLDEKTNTVELLDEEEETGKRKREKIVSFSSFLPEAGVYLLEKGSVLMITRNPRKQYAKSWSRNSHNLKLLYNDDSYFGLNAIKNPTSIPQLLQQIVDQKVKNIVADIDKTIWFWDIAIGYVANSGEIMCTNSNFVQELKDWSRDA